MNGKKEVSKRVYTKLQQALAGTVALIRVAFVAGTLLLIPCNRTKFYQTMIGEHYSFYSLDGKPRKPRSNKVLPMSANFDHELSR